MAGVGEFRTPYARQSYLACCRGTWRRVLYDARNGRQATSPNLKMVLVIQLVRPSRAFPLPRAANSMFHAPLPLETTA